MNGTGIKEEATCASGIEWTPELERELLTPDERLSCRLDVQVMCALVDARQEKHIGPRELAAMSGVNRSGFSRIAMGAANPSVWTLIKMLTSLVEPASPLEASLCLQHNSLRDHQLALSACRARRLM